MTRPMSHRILDRLGLVMLGCGVLLVIVLTWVGGIEKGLEIGLMILGFVLAVSGLRLNRRYRDKEE